MARPTPVEEPEHRDPPGPDWNAIVAQHDHRVFVSVLALGLSVDAARDVAQLTWSRLFEKYQSGELGELRLPGLAIRQARFLALDHQRRVARNRAQVTALTQVDALREQVANDPETRLLDKEQLGRARAALATCAPRSRDVFTRVYEHPEQSHAEVAASFGLSVQRTRQILCEVRKVIRTALEDQS